MSNWISVEENTPEEDYNFGGTGFSREVLIRLDDDTIEVGYFVYPWRNQKLYGFAGHQEKQDVVAWKYSDDLDREFYEWS